MALIKPVRTAKIFNIFSFTIAKVVESFPEYPNQYLVKKRDLVSPENILLKKNAMVLVMNAMLEGHDIDWKKGFWSHLW